MEEETKININGSKGGFSLLDALVGTVLFALISIVVYQSYLNLTRLVRLSTIRVAAAALLDEEIETIRNLPYQDIGLQGGIPPGKLTQSKTVERSGKTFTTTLYIRSVDDPFDGTIGGSPNDTAPADYKLVDITIVCTGCKDFAQFSATTTVAPKNLEISSGNGALFVRVFDAAGIAVSQAQVHIQNTSLNPPVSFDEVTNNSGVLQLVDVPPSLDGYEVTVTKSGYSQDKTYPSNAPGNPNPVKPHLTVVANGVTQASFAIDKLSQLTARSMRNNCKALGPIGFQMTGAKLIGVSPDVIKYQQNHSTDSLGSLVLPSMEWDTYTIQVTSPSYYLEGSLPSLPKSLAPNAQDSWSLIMTPKTTNALLVELKDASTFLPIAHAQVNPTGPGYNKTLNSGEGYWQQTDWSGGSGQETFASADKYLSDSDTIDTRSPTGELTLKKIGSTYAPSGWLISSTFDNSTSTNFYSLTARPLSQPPEAGPNPIQIQIASNKDNATWNFVGPDGTAATFYTPADTSLNPIHNGDQYIRYKVSLQTADTAFTPNLSDVAVSFASACTPSGQVYFNDVGTGGYTLNVTKTGYQPYTAPITINSGWQQQTIYLTPQ